MKWIILILIVAVVVTALIFVKKHMDNKKAAVDPTVNPEANPPVTGGNMGNLIGVAIDPADVTFIPADASEANATGVLYGSVEVAPA